jgi:phenylpyruvate tautomerase
MPLLKVQISLPEISKSSSCKVRTKGTEILSSAIGKSPEFVMVIVESGLCASFGGNQTEPCAYLEVKNVGELPPSITGRLSRILGELMEKEFGIDPNRIYIEFQESERHLWGWNGKTFA